MTAVRVVDLPADQMAAEVVAALLFTDQRPLEGAVGLLDWRLNGQLTSLILENGVSGKTGETIVVQNNGKLSSDWALFFGAGKSGQEELSRLRSVLPQLFKCCRQAGFKRVGLCLDVAGAITETVAGLVEELAADRMECLLSFNHRVIGLGAHDSHPGSR